VGGEGVGLVKLQMIMLEVAEQLLKYSIELEHKPNARIEDAVFMRIQAERLVNAAERTRV
jgi:hypothetical protein